MWYARFVIALVFCISMLAANVFSMGSANASTLPPGAYKLYPYFYKEAVRTHGVDVPLALLAGLIHQESRWRSDVVSPAGAVGLAQFMPSTAKWVPDINSSLRGGSSLDPRWSIRAMNTYTLYLYNMFPVSDECDRWMFTLSGYNGGQGWVVRDRKLASELGMDEDAWFDNVELTTRRAAWAKKENRQYVDMITRKWQPLYFNEGLGLYGDLICKRFW